MVGALFKLTPTTNVFASIGQGFETPTFVELAYRPDGAPGLNFDLEAAESENAEVGVRTQLGEGAHATATAFLSSTRNEVVSRCRRAGAIPSPTPTAPAARAWNWRWMRRWAARSRLAAYTLTKATFEEYVTFAGVDLSGNRIPGVPEHLFAGELAWRGAGSGLSAALELRVASKVPVNDANSAAAGSYEVANLRGG